MLVPSQGLVSYLLTIYEAPPGRGRKMKTKSQDATFARAPGASGQLDQRITAMTGMVPFLPLWAVGQPWMAAKGCAISQSLKMYSNVCTSCSWAQQRGSRGNNYKKM